jgi:hypothetical protein
MHANFVRDSGVDKRMQKLGMDFDQVVGASSFATTLQDCGLRYMGSEWVRSMAAMGAGCEVSAVGSTSYQHVSFAARWQPRTPLYSTAALKRLHM